MQIIKLTALLFGLAISGVVADPTPDEVGLEVRAEQTEQMKQVDQAQAAEQHEQTDQEHQGKKAGSWYPWRPRPRPNNWCPPGAWWCRQPRPNPGYCPPGAWWCRQPGPGPNPGYCPFIQCVNDYCYPQYDNFFDTQGTCTSGQFAGCTCNKCGGSNGGNIGSCRASNGCNGQGYGYCQGGEYAGCPCKDDGGWFWKA